MKPVRVLLLLVAVLFSSTVAQGQLPEGLLSCSQHVLQCGNKIEAVLPEAGCITSCGEWASIYRIQVFANTTLVTVTATAVDFDPRLDLLDGDGDLITSNDSFSGTPNARVQRVLVPGRYLVRVVGQPAGDEGAYSISLTCTIGDPQVFCQPDDATLCFRGRFSVRLTARNPRTGAEVMGKARPQNELYGYFSFPSLTNHQDNPEVFVKLIDGRSVNGHWWVFFGGLTDLDYELTVRDSFTRNERTYEKNAENGCDGWDTLTFEDP